MFSYSLLCISSFYASFVYVQSSVLLLTDVRSPDPP